MRSTAGLLTDRAEAAGPALFFELALTVLATAPGAGELPANADRSHHLEEASAAAFAVLGQAPLQVLAGTQVVTGVLITVVEMEQIDHTISLGRPAASGRLPGVTVGYAPLQ